MTSENVPLPNLTQQGAQLPPPQTPQTALSGPVSPQPKTRGKRGKKDEPPPPPPPPLPPPSEQELAQLAVALGGTFKLVFAVVAANRGKHWLLADDEREVLGQLWAGPCMQLFQRYGKYMVWAVAILGTASVVQPRLEKDAELATEEQEREKNAKTENADGPGSAGPTRN